MASSSPLLSLGNLTAGCTWDPQALNWGEVGSAHSLQHWHEEKSSDLPLGQAFTSLSWASAFLFGGKKVRWESKEHCSGGLFLLPGSGQVSSSRQSDAPQQWRPLVTVLGQRSASAGPLLC